MEQEDFMSRQLEMPDELFDALQAAANAHGTTPLGWIAAHLPSEASAADGPSPTQGSPKTLADLLAGRVGRIRSGSETDLSVACGEKFSDYVD
jgi:hypothetical protein